MRSITAFMTVRSDIYQWLIAICNSDTSRATPVDKTRAGLIVHLYSVVDGVGRDLQLFTVTGAAALLRLLKQVAPISVDVTECGNTQFGITDVEMIVNLVTG